MWRHLLPAFWFCRTVIAARDLKVDQSHFTPIETSVWSKEPLDEIGHGVEVSKKGTEPILLSTAIEQSGFTSTGGSWVMATEPWRQIGHSIYAKAEEQPTWDDIFQGDVGFGKKCTNYDGTCTKHGLVCRNRMCSPCRRSSDCPIHSKCAENIQDIAVCVPQNVPPWEEAFSGSTRGYWLLLASLVIFVTAVLAATAGVGGGGIFVPVLIILCGKAPAQAVPVAQVMIFTGSVINLVSFITQRHPEIPHMPVVDYNCIALLEPLLCTGVVLGVIAGQACPSWFLVLLLAVTLLPAISRTGTKGKKQWSEEKARDERAAFSDREQGEATQERKGCCGRCCDILMAPFKFQYKAFADGHINSFMGILRTNYKAVLMVVVVWVAVFCIFMLWGRSLQVCSYNYLIFLSVSIGGFAMLTWLIGRFVVTLDRQDPLEAKHSVDWRKAAYKFPLVGMVAGFLGGLLGLGGGVIMSPVLLELGMHSEAVQATTATFVFISSSVATLQFILMQMYQWEEVLWYCSLTFTATAIGQWVFGAWIRKTKRYSLITLSIAGILFLSLIALSIIGCLQTYQDWNTEGAMDFHFENVCGRSPGKETIVAAR